VAKPLFGLPKPYGSAFVFFFKTKRLEKPCGIWIALAWRAFDRRRRDCGLNGEEERRREEGCFRVSSLKTKR
jgi:hypothetical protein